MVEITWKQKQVSVVFCEPVGLCCCPASSLHSLDSAVPDCARLSKNRKQNGLYVNISERNSPWVINVQKNNK